jgi:hypothetical protein
MSLAISSITITFNVVISPVSNVAIVDVPQRWCEVALDVRHSEVVNAFRQSGMSSNQSSYCLTIVNQIEVLRTIANGRYPMLINFLTNFFKDLSCLYARAKPNSCTLRHNDWQK